MDACIHPGALARVHATGGRLLRGGEEVVLDDVRMRAEEVTGTEVVDNDVWMRAEEVTETEVVDMHVEEVRG